MTSEYSFTIGNPSHFGNVTPNLGVLHREVLADSNITKEFLGINRYGDDVKFVFSGNLTASEESALNTLITGHEGLSLTIFSSAIPVTFHNFNQTSKVWKRMGSFSFEGTDTMIPLKRIDFVGYAPDGGTYSVRVFDVDHGVVIADQEFSNNLEQSNSFTTLSNLPSTRAMLEIQGKKNTAKSFLCWSATFYF